MSKDQVWKFIFVFHTNIPKTIFPDFSILANRKVFSILEDCVGSLPNAPYVSAPSQVKSHNADKCSIVESMI